MRKREKRDWSKSPARLAMLWRLLWQADAAYLPLLVGYAAVGAGQILCNVLLPRCLIDELTSLGRPGALLFWGGAIVASNGLWFLLDKGMNSLLHTHMEKMRDGVDTALAQKIMHLPYHYLEDPKTLDLYERARFAMQNQSIIENMVSVFAKTVRQAVTLAGLLAVLLQLSWVLVALLLGTVGLLLVVQALFSRYEQSFYAQIVPINRRYNYYFGQTMEKLPQKDFRLYGLGRLMTDKAARYNEKVCDEFDIFYRRLGLSQAAMQMVLVLQTALAYGFVGIQCMASVTAGGMGVGSLTMYVSAAISFSAAIQEFGHAFIQLRQNLAYLVPFTELMALPEENAHTGGLPLDGPICGIRFEHVTFCYPGSEKPVLEDVSFAIEQGQKISIVGLNGAGKSTVVKLLCGLYQPQAGRILINGHALQEYDPASLQAAIAAVFQDFRLLDVTIEENVTGKAPGEDPAGATKQLTQVGLADRVAELPQGIATRLGKSYDEKGTELSGGQNQKLAIARALYKQASLVILDEPTSALDPMAEAEIYENLRDLAGDNTAVFISHRMSSSTFCDRILVLQDGHVVAFDTHEHLMQDSSGLYSRLFCTQAANYQT